MNRKTIVTALTGLAMACLVSFAAMGAMITALDLPVAHMAHLHTAWIITALIGCAIFSFKKGWLPALLLAAAGIVYLWEYHYLSLPIRALITRLSWIYDSAYGWGILEFAGVNWRETSLDLILGAWGCLIALTTAGAVVGGRGQLLPLTLALLPFCSTVVVTNTPADAPYIFALILGIVLLLLPATVRQHSPGQGAKLTLMTALPVGLLLAILFAACPQDTYVNHSQEYLNNVVTWWQSGIFNFQGSSGPLQQTVSASGTTTNLRRVGPRPNSNAPVMEVTSSAGGTIYLRGQDYDTYTGTDWIAGASRNEEFSAMYPTGDIVTVKTRRPMNVIYLPYYPETEFLTGGKIRNDENLTEYFFPIYEVPEISKVLNFGSTITIGTVEIETEDVELEAGIGEGMTSEEIQEQLMLQRFTALPMETQQWAEDYVNRNLHIYKGNFPEYSIAAERIAGHVRQSALYNKNTPRMDGEDFARWFLEESDTGYCVHFATAAAVLLRSVGIPARYVTGYMATCAPHEATTVTANRAHAWVEYYEPRLRSWIPLEATPPDFTENETEPPTQTEPTESATDAPTEGETEAASRPQAPRPGASNTPKLDLKPLWTVLKWVTGIALAWALVLTQYRIRHKLAQQGSPNTLALRKWQSVDLLCRVTKQTPPEELEELAQKAKFSQYTLTDEELRAFDAWLAAEQAKPRPWYLGFVCKYMLALW